MAGLYIQVPLLSGISQPPPFWNLPAPLQSSSPPPIFQPPPFWNLPAPLQHLLVRSSACDQVHPVSLAGVRALAHDNRPLLPQSPPSLLHQPLLQLHVGASLMTVGIACGASIVICATCLSAATAVLASLWPQFGCTFDCEFDLLWGVHRPLSGSGFLELKFA